MREIQSTSSLNAQNNVVESNLSNSDHKLLMKYKELIRQQDEQLTSLKTKIIDLETQNEILMTELNQQQPIIEQLRDQIALLKAQKSSYNVLNDTTNSNLKDQQKQSDDDNEIDSRNQYIMKKNSLSNSNSTFSNQMNYSSSYNNPSNVSLNSAETNLESIVILLLETKTFFIFTFFIDQQYWTN